SWSSRRRSRQPPVYTPSATWWTTYCRTRSVLCGLRCIRRARCRQSGATTCGRPQPQPLPQQGRRGSHACCVMSRLSTQLAAAGPMLPGAAPPPAYMARVQGDPEMESLVTGIWHGLKNVREFGSLLHPESAVDEVVKRRREREKGQFWERGHAEWERWKIDLL